MVGNISEFQTLKKAAEARGHSLWGRGPDNAGSYNPRPHEIRFFYDRGDYNSYYGRFFINWYSQVLVDHGDRVLALAKFAFEGTCIAAKVSQLPGVFFYARKYKTAWALQPILLRWLCSNCCIVKEARGCSKFRIGPA